LRGLCGLTTAESLIWIKTPLPGVTVASPIRHGDCSKDEELPCPGKSMT
jgi:hypothetical protein